MIEFIRTSTLTNLMTRCKYTMTSNHFFLHFISQMASTSSVPIWSSMIAARQLSMTYYTLSTCLTDFLHRYFATSSSQTTTTITLSSSLFHNLDETFFSSSNSTNQSKLLDDYSNIIQNILK